MLLYAKMVSCYHCFNTTGVCIPEKHYMVNISGRLQQIRELVDAGNILLLTGPDNMVRL